MFKLMEMVLVVGIVLCSAKVFSAAGDVIDMDVCKSHFPLPVFRPVGVTFEEVSKEIAEKVSKKELFTCLDLHHQASMFEDENRQFEPVRIREFIDILPLEVKILILPKNRFSVKAVSSFFPLLEREEFDFLVAKNQNSSSRLKKVFEGLVAQLSSHSNSHELLKKTIWLTQGAVKKPDFDYSKYGRSFEELRGEIVDSHLRYYTQMQGIGGIEYEEANSKIDLILDYFDAELEEEEPAVSSEIVRALIITEEITINFLDYIQTLIVEESQEDIDIPSGPAGVSIYLMQIKDRHKKGPKVGSLKRNRQSLYNWIVYSRARYSLAYCRDYQTHEVEGLQQDIKRISHLLPTIDLHLPEGQDYKLSFFGIWSLVATFNKTERADLIKALEKETFEDQNLVKVLQAYNFEYKIKIPNIDWQ